MKRNDMDNPVRRRRKVDRNSGRSDSYYDEASMNSSQRMSVPQDYGRQNDQKSDLRYRSNKARSKYSDDPHLRKNKRMPNYEPYNVLDLNARAN